jgi:hypothetical protein
VTYLQRIGAAVPGIARCATTILCLLWCAHSTAAVTVEPGADLAQALRTFGSIRLRSDASYVRGGGVLRLASGQSLEAGWNTRLPVIEIPAGTHDVALVGLGGLASRGVDVVFTGGAAVTGDVRIVGAAAGPAAHPKIRIDAGARIERLTIANYGGLEVLQGRSGYVRDSTFSRLIGYRPGSIIDWRGNDAEPSRGNVFLGIAAITPARGLRWSHAGDLWLFGLDCESWNAGGDGWPSCITVANSPRVVSIGLSGGTAYPKGSGPLATFTHVGTLLSWFRSGHGGGAGRSDFVFDDVGDLVTLQRHVDSSESTIGDGNRTDILALPTRPGWRDSKVSTRDVDRLATWARTPLPSFGSLPVARDGGPRVASNPTATGGESDDGDWIQKAIDERGVVHLPPGRYLLHRPLRMGSRDRPEGLIGAGHELTELVAAGSFPLIAGRGDFGRRDPARSPVALVQFVLQGIRLVGGTEGVLWTGEAGNLGPAAQVAHSEFTDVEWLDQTVAAVRVEGIFGIDNVAWRHVAMRGVPVGFLGRGHGTGLGMNYADKQYFLDAQFHDVKGAVWDWVTDRPSGGNVWHDAYFRRVGRLSHTRAAMGLTWINSVFEDLGASTAIAVEDGDGRTRTGYFALLGCEFRGHGPSVVTDTPSDLAGTLMIATKFRQDAGTLVPPTGHQGLSAWGSRISGGAQAGSLFESILMSSTFSRELAGTLVLSAGQRTDGDTGSPREPRAH